MGKKLLILFVVSLNFLLISSALGGESMKLTTPAFEHDGMIPREYTCQGDDRNPQLNIEGIPEGARSLALIVDDPDAPGRTWVHWVLFNLDPSQTVIEEDSEPGMHGINDFGRQNYGGPCPPSGVHRYFFKLYALDTRLKLKNGVTKKDLEKAMEGHILEEAQLIGRYQKY